ncbi:MAG TPA: hypothetical protein VEW25_11610 [Allosphingosinicella sp.]|nr:hypothetical protein [Allosphingosinicella sp.]
MLRIISRAALVVAAAFLSAAAVAQLPLNAPAPRTAAAGEESVYCHRLLDVTTPEICQDANVRVQNLPVGTGRLAPPNPVFRDSPVTVYFEVGTTNAPSNLEAGPDVRIYNNVQLAGHMSAVLVGEGFRIDPPAPSGGQNGGSPRRAAPGGGFQWRWSVTALDAPRHNLRIELYAHIPIKNKNGGDEYGVRPVLTRSVHLPVQRTAGQFFGDLGTWVSRGTSGVELVTGLIVAFGALLAAWFALPGLRRRRRKAAENYDRLHPAP